MNWHAMITAWLFYYLLVTGHLTIRDKTLVPMVSVIEFPLYTVNLIPGWKYEWHIISEGMNGL